MADDIEALADELLEGRDDEPVEDEIEEAGQGEGEEEPEAEEEAEDETVSEPEAQPPAGEIEQSEDPERREIEQIRQWLSEVKANPARLQALAQADNAFLSGGSPAAPPQAAAQAPAPAPQGLPEIPLIQIEDEEYVAPGELVIAKQANAALSQANEVIKGLAGRLAAMENDLGTRYSRERTQEIDKLVQTYRDRFVSELGAQPPAGFETGLRNELARYAPTQVPLDAVAEQQYKVLGWNAMVQSKKADQQKAASAKKPMVKSTATASSTPKPKPGAPTDPNSLIERLADRMLAGRAKRK